MEPSKIIEITKQRNRFSVSLRWRDIPLQKICNKMVREGLLEKVGRVHRQIVYVLPKTKWRISDGGYLVVIKEMKP